MTCTCTRPREAHIILPVGWAERTEPCGREDCPCVEYEEEP